MQIKAATPQTSQTAVPVTYTNTQQAGDTNIIAIGWNNTTSTITAVTDTAGNTYQAATPTTRGTGISQAIYYAPNIKAAPAATNTVTVTFNTATPYVDIRATEYSGLATTNPLDLTTSATGTSTTATNATLTTTTPNELLFAAGTTTGGFTTAGTGFTTRLITTPDADITEDQTATTPGTYTTTAPLGGTAPWILQTATFKPAAATTTAGSFQNEVLATGLDLPTAIKFLPDGRMLVAELAGKIKVLPPPYTQADPTPFLQLTNVGSAGDGTVAQQGIYDLALDPNFATNHYYYISYTAQHTQPRSPLALHGQCHADRHRTGERTHHLPGSPGRQHRTPRRRNQFRQRREDLPHHRRPLPGHALAGSDQSARQGPALQPRRHGADRQPVL